MGTVLIFNINDKQTLGAVSLLADRNGFSPRAVLPSEYGNSLGALAGLPGCPKGALPAPPVPEPMLVFCEEMPGATSAVLAGLRTLGITVGLKAMLTETNAEWTPGKLATELSREREALAKIKNNRERERK